MEDVDLILRRDVTSLYSKRLKESKFMNLSSLIINNKTLGKQLLLIDVLPVYVYEDGKRTQEIEGYRYVVTLPEKQFEKIGIKILGEQLIDKPDGYVEVTFDGLELFLYWRNGQYELGATATGVHIKA